MHRQRVLPSDSSVGLKHGREKRNENLYMKHSLSVYRRGECKLTDVQLTSTELILHMQTEECSVSQDNYGGRFINSFNIFLFLNFIISNNHCGVKYLVLPPHHCR